MEPITISGLTADQVTLLNKMWQIEDIEDLQEWKSTLSAPAQHQVDLLLTLVSLAATDEPFVQDLSAARVVLQKFQV